MQPQLHRASRIPESATVFLPFGEPRGKIRPARNFRTTWLASSLAVLRERDLMQSYLRELPSELHPHILGSVAGQWAPMELAVHHYQACDRLGLDDRELEGIGADVTRRVHGTMLSTLIKLARQSGVTPWVAFAQCHKLWSRIFDGGGICVYQLGPKDAVIEVVGWPIAENRYIQRSMPSVIRGAIQPFCRRAYAVQLRNLSGLSTYALHASWA